MVTPATKLSTATVSVEMTKSIAFVVVSRELMEMSGAGVLRFLQRELTGAVARVTDDSFITVLTAGISAIPSSGGTALGVRADLRALADSVDTGARSKLYFITTSSLAKRLATIGDSAGGQAFPDVTMTGGTLAGVPVVISDSVASGVLILADAAQLVVAAGDIELSASDEADVQLNDGPDSPPSASTSMTNMWQNNLLALRATRYLGVARGRTTAVATISGFTGLGNSPS